MTRLKKFFSPPQFPDEIKTQQAFMLHVILWTLMIVPVVLAIYHLIFRLPNREQTLIRYGSAEVVNVVLLVMLHRGYVRGAALLQVITFWFFFTFSAFTGGGVQGESYLLGYSLVIGIAGILLGGAGATIFTVLSLLAGIVLIDAQTWQLKSTAYVLDSPVTTWVVSLVLFPLGAVLQNLASRALRDALGRARASEERYRLISQITSDYTFSTELDEKGDMRLNWVAGAFTEITGFAYEEYVATGGWRAHLYPGDLAQDDHDMDTLRTNNKVVTEVRHYKKNGELRWARVYGHPIWDPIHNRLGGIVGAVQDITEQKQAEEALRKSEAIYRKAIELAGAVPYHQTYVDHKVLYDFIGEGIYEITGYPPAEMNEYLWDSLIIDRVLLGDLAEFSWDDAVQRVRSGERLVWRCEHCLRARDGKLHWVYEAAVELRDQNNISHGSIGLFQDITDQKFTEEQKARQRNMLEKVILLGKQVNEVNDLWTTLDRIWHGIHDDFGFDRVGIFLYNEERNSMDSTFGTDREGKQEKTWGNFFPIEQGSIFKVVLEKPDSYYFTTNYQVENNVAATDEMYGVTYLACVAAWAGDKPVAAISVDNLVTGRPINAEQLEALRLYAGYIGLAIENARLNESLQNELNQKKSFINELESKNAELERFTYTVSHDLKSPLVTITGFLGFLERDAVAGNIEKVKSSSRRISSAAKKMEQLLSDLLELSRIGRLMNPAENLPFAEIVAEALERVRGRMEANQVRVTVQGDLPVVHGDRVRLVEVVQNLLDNAAKFSGGRSDAQVEVGLAGTDEYHLPILFVCDNGIGIAPQYHERIFGLFNKLNPDIEGTGIGLTLVKRIIEVHGGRIWVESEPDKGTSFYFTLPPQKPN